MPNSTWQKSSYSAANSQCIEVRAASGVIELRESDEGDVIIRTAAHQFGILLQGAKAGEFDHLITSRA